MSSISDWRLRPCLVLLVFKDTGEDTFVESMQFCSVITVFYVCQPFWSVGGAKYTFENPSSIVNWVFFSMLIL